MPLHQVELITIGDELLLGFTIDTNGAYLAQRLAALGIGIARRTSVGDEIETVISVAKEALDRTGAIVTTGGLGPTSDDVTRDAIARVFGRELVVDEAHVVWMQDRWRTRFGRDMPESNRRQAMIPAGARKLDNKHGSAPGVYIEDDRGRFAVLLPGVPRELRGMTDDVLVPLLTERGRGEGGGGGNGAVIKSLTLRTTGIAESLLADRIDGALDANVRPLAALAYLPGVDGVDLRLTARAGDTASADAVLRRLGDAIRETVPEFIYGENSEDLAELLLEQSRRRSLRIAVAESCTGGMLGARLTAIPGSSDTFVGGVIAYSDEVKTRELGVPQRLIEEHGAVSEPVVREMAHGARRKFAVEIALAITGVAGPGGGTPEKPVGTVWVCSAIGDHVESRKIQSWGDRQEIRSRASQAAMDLCRRMLGNVS